MSSTPTPPTPEQVRLWQQQARVRYPDFEPLLQVQNTQVGWRYSLHFRALRGAPRIVPDAGFPLEPRWYPLEMWWRQDGSTQLDFLYSLYPDQSSLLREYRRPTLARPFVFALTASIGAILAVAPHQLQALTVVVALSVWLLSVLTRRARTRARHLTR